jgi:hypothetical protein
MEGFDIQAFQYVIHIIHGNNRQVPLSVDLDTLGKIALVVDDLQCDEAAERHVLGWAVALQKQASEAGSTMPGQDLVIWLFICRTLRFLPVDQTECILDFARWNAVLHSTGRLGSRGLPIPDRWLGMSDIPDPSILLSVPGTDSDL